jgi:hypothetical protein
MEEGGKVEREEKMRPRWTRKREEEETEGKESKNEGNIRMRRRN